MRAKNRNIQTAIAVKRREQSCRDTEMRDGGPQWFVVRQYARFVSYITGCRLTVNVTCYTFNWSKNANIRDGNCSGCQSSGGRRGRDACTCKPRVSFSRSTVFLSNALGIIFVGLASHRRQGGHYPERDDLEFGGSGILTAASVYEPASGRGCRKFLTAGCRATRRKSESPENDAGQRTDPTRASAA